MCVTCASPYVTKEPNEHEGKLGAHLKILKALRILLSLKHAISLASLGHNL